MLNAKDSKTNYGTAINMTREEKDISFMNRYFVFQKSRNIENVNLVQKQMNEDSESVIIDAPIVASKISKLDAKVIINSDLQPEKKKRVTIRVKKTLNKVTE
jgi:hypothetical protein